MFPKDKVLTSKKYLEWIRDQQCIGCGREGDTEAHHLRGVGALCGAAQKNHDIFAMPLCRDCHSSMHSGDGGIKSQFEMIVRTIDRAIKAGIITNKGI